MSGPKLEILLCAPRGFCAGVERAIQVVEVALERFGAPVYVRHEIVHNRYVVESLKAKGAVFVEELEEIPDIGPAGGLLGAWRAKSGARWRQQAEHLRARRHLPARLQGPQGSDPATARRGHEIVLVGHAGHPEVEGTMGQLPDGAITLVETAEDARTFQPREPDNLAWITQTTLSVDDTSEIVAVLKERFPTSPARTRKTSATPPPTARKR